MDKNNNGRQYIEKLRALSCGRKFIDFQEKIVKTNKEIIGVKTPDIRKLAKEVIKNNNFDCLLSINTNCFEEVLLKAIVCGSLKDKVKAKQELEKILECFDNWAEVDMTASGLKCISKTQEDFCWFKSFLTSDKEFIVRFGVVGLMKYFISEDWINNTFEALKVVKCDKYYVNMAIAWLISEVLIKNPQNNLEIMQKIIQSGQFSVFIINKAIQKARESYRIDVQTKEILKGLKIK